MDNNILDEIVRKMDIVQRRFEECFGLQLFLNYDLVSVSNLSTKVVDIDSLRGKLIDLVVQLIENINKHGLDKLTKIKTKGSLHSLEIFLKKQFPEDTQKIEQQIYDKLWAIYNIRTEYVHKKSRNFKKALALLNIDQNDLAPENVWYSCTVATSEVLTYLIELVFQDSSNQCNDDYFVDLAIERLKTEARIDVINLLLDYPDAEAYLHILINKKGMLDTELAEMLNQDVTTVRRNLYPLLSKVLLYSYRENGATCVRIMDEVLSVVKGVLEDNEDEKS